ncbi:hypothetical protein ACFV0B_07870 [Streptomyces xanthophaeus]|uniref:hypothetical protein n=1 Tax=Streptomyces xanthophaeus TaxID=67385 RepID=UPI0036BB4A08
MSDEDTGRAGHQPQPTPKPAVQPQRARASARSGASGPVAAGPRPMPGTVSSLRVLMMVVGGVQALLGLGLVTNSVAVATKIWGEANASTPCCTTPGEAHAGIVVFGGLISLAVAAWGIGTALKFPTRRRGLRVSAAAYGWAALPFVLLTGVTVLFVAVVWPVLAILIIIRANHRDAREWFDRQPL